MQVALRFTTCVLLLGATVLDGSRTSAEEAYPPREVPARSLPVPRTVSPELQKAIAAPSVFNPKIVPQTADEWRALQTIVNGAASRRAVALAKQLDVTITPTTM